LDNDFEYSKSQFPVIELWDNILVVPIVGSMDSTRTRELMETLLRETRNMGAKVVIIDLSGVAVMDTEVSRRLLNLGEAVRLMGADYKVCGIKPDQVHSMVDLGINLEAVETHHDLNSALNDALGTLNMGLQKKEAEPE